MATTIEEIVSSFSTTPVLFVGSGLTRRYLNLPNWENLLSEFAKRLSFNDPFIFASYKNKATQQLEKDGFSQINKEDLLPLTATLIERDFNTRWFEEPFFRKVTNPIRLKQIQASSLSPFKAEIAHYLEQYSTPNPQYISEINDLKALFDKHISGIITTNYDTFIESIADGYTTYIGQNELIFSPIQGIGEIYKIHGSVTKPESIILNQSDYHQFKKHEAYLASKLLTIFMEYPIIFIGYSMGDKNIRAILESITECLNENQLKKLQQRFIFVSHKHVSGAPEIQIIQPTIGNKTFPMTEIKLYNYSDLYRVLITKKRALPVCLARFFKEQLYNYSLSSIPNESVMMVAPIDDTRVKDQDLMIAIGARESLVPFGLVGKNVKDLYRDILFNDLGYSADNILQYAYPSMKKSNIKLPIFKYLSQAKHPHPEIPEEDYHVKDYESYFLTPTLLKKSKKDFQKDIKEKTISYIISRGFLDYKTLMYIALLGPDNLNVNELYDFLLDFYKKKIETNLAEPPIRSEFRRLIRIYDWLKYSNKKQEL